MQPYSIPASERVSKVKEQSTRSQKRASERSVDGHYQNDQTYEFTRSLAFTKASERVQCGRCLRLELVRTRTFERKVIDTWL